MPMSCSRQAAQSSSRSAAPRSCSPAAARPSNIVARERPHVQVVLALVLEAVREVLHRLAAHVVEQLALAEQALEEDPLAQARLGHLDRVEAALLDRGAEHERAAEDHVGAVVLDALHLRRASRRGGRRARSISSSSASRVSWKPCTSMSGRSSALHRRGRQVADRPADADEAAAALPPAEPLELAGHVVAQRLHLLRGSPSRRAGSLAHPHRAERQRLGLQRAAVPRCEGPGCCRRRCRARSRPRSSWSSRWRASRSGPPRVR